MLVKDTEAKRNELTKWHKHFVLFAHVGNNKFAVCQTVERRAVYFECFDKLHRVFEYRLPNSNMPKDVAIACAAKTKISSKSTSPKKAKSGTKKEKVESIVKSMNGKHKSSEIIEAIISEMGMSKAGASTYYYNARKSLGISG